MRFKRSLPLSPSPSRAGRPPSKPQWLRPAGAPRLTFCAWYPAAAVGDLFALGEANPPFFTQGPREARADLKQRPDSRGRAVYCLPFSK